MTNQQFLSAEQMNQFTLNPCAVGGGAVCILFRYKDTLPTFLNHYLEREYCAYHSKNLGTFVAGASITLHPSTQTYQESYHESSQAV